MVGLLAAGFHSDGRLWHLGKEAQHRHLGLAVADHGLVTSYFTFGALGFREVAGLTSSSSGWRSHLAPDPRYAKPQLTAFHRG